jgi:hypothetical protein
MRRTAGAIALLLAATAVAVGARELESDQSSGPAAAKANAKAKKSPQRLDRPPPPAEIRGVHVTMALASIPGKIEEYTATLGLNTVELDVKDENGEIGFHTLAPPVARQIGAAMRYYDPTKTAKTLHEQGIYVIGRVVCFEDPILSEKRPELAITTTGGDVWRNHAGLGWTNPYDKRVWDYNLAVAKAAVRAGFDEIQFDYVRFPSDGDIDSAVFAGRRPEAMSATIARFVHYAANRLRPLGARVSVDVFGLSATRNLGIGQSPRRLARIVDAIYPMVYPSHFGSGEYGLEDPNASPGATIEWSLADFRRELKKGNAELIPWLQDFSYGRTYGLSEVKAQIDAARLMGARGYLLWNPLGIYTPGTLAPAS